MANKKIEINRAPVLTLWATIVAERLGYDKKESLTLGKAVAGLNAQSKGKHLGIYEEKKDSSENKEAKKESTERVYFIELLGRGIPAIKTTDGMRASIKGETVKPEGVQDYLEKKFGEDLDVARAAMEALAKAFKPKELEVKAYGLYEKFRPEIPAGKKGWGVKGELDLNYIRSLGE
jgi:hypothetical protein